MSTRFLGAISSFKTPEPLKDENWERRICPMLELNGVRVHCEEPGIAPPEEDVDWRAEGVNAEWVDELGCRQAARVLNNLSAPQFVHVSQAATVKRPLYEMKARDGDDITRTPAHDGVQSE